MKNKSASALGKLSAEKRHAGKSPEDISKMYSELGKRPKKVVPTPLLQSNAR